MTTSHAVHLVFKTHLDIGFTDLSREVVATYLERFVPQAIETADRIRDEGEPPGFVWTSGSWLLYEYLERAPAAGRRRLERAVEDGAIRWHALPFTTHSEYMDPELFDFGLSLSRELDERFGKKTIAANMTDVPGHTIGIVPLLARAGVEFLHVGINAVCAMADVPPVFVWRHEDGSEVTVVMKNGYGGVVTVPEAGATLIVDHPHDATGDQDNIGPHTPEQVRDVFAEARRLFPDADIAASKLDDFAARLRPVKQKLPVVDEEIGDTWIHGVGSDPVKTAQYRELCRLRRSWLSRPGSGPSPADMSRFTRRLMLVPEHTWGMDVKKHLHDFTHYGRRDFQSIRDEPNFRLLEESWAEQRAYLDEAIAELQDEDLVERVRDRLEGLRPRRPDRGGMEILKAPDRMIGTEHYEVAFDPSTGAIIHLQERSSDAPWATGDYPLGTFGYQTFSQSDYDRYLKQYHTRETDWSVPDFSKPGMDRTGAESRWWKPKACEISWGRTPSGHQFLAELTMPEIATEEYGCPPTVIIEYDFPDGEPRMEGTVQWVTKPVCRLPEAIWFSFSPRTFHSPNWYLEKMGSRISPLRVVRNGNRSLHAVTEGVTCEDGDRRLEIETRDAPLVAPGNPSLLRFDNAQPNMDNGVHFNLYNNVWGTNFTMWFDEGAKFRFGVRTFPRG